MFKITGTVDGVKATCEWKKGKFTGDKIVLDKAKIENLKNHGFLGHPLDGSDSNYLQNEFAALPLLIKFVFDENYILTDNWHLFDKRIEKWEKEGIIVIR